MLDNDNIWKDRFNENELNEESWLQPSDHVIDQVMNKVESPKKRKLIWLIWIFFALSIVISAYFTFVKSYENKLDKELNSGIALVESTNDKSSTQNKVLNEATSGLITSMNELSFSSEQNNNSKNNSSEKVIGSKEVPIETNSVKEDITESSIDIINSQSKNLKVAESTTINQSIYQNTLEQKQNTEVNQLDQNSVFSIKSNAQINLVALPTIKSFPDNTSRIIAEPDFVMYNSPIEPISNKNQSFGFVSAVGKWDFALNGNFATALSPADFTHDKGKSFSWGATYGTTINKRLSWGIQVLYESVEFHSGHNSSVTYHAINEMEGHHDNDFNLVMASPIGFLSSDITVERRTSEDLPPTDLVVDLHNTHKLKNLDFQAFIAYNAFRFGSFDLNLRAGLGVNNFFGLENSLDSFGINNSSFASGASDIESDQMNLNSNSLYGSFGLGIDYHINSDFRLGVYLACKQNFNAIYNESDFNTQLSRQNIAIEFVKKF